MGPPVYLIYLIRNTVLTAACSPSLSVLSVRLLWHVQVTWEEVQALRQQLADAQATLQRQEAELAQAKELAQSAQALAQQVLGVIHQHASCNAPAASLGQAGKAAPDE